MNEINLLFYNVFQKQLLYSLVVLQQSIQQKREHQRIKHIYKHVYSNFEFVQETIQRANRELLVFQNPQSENFYEEVESFLANFNFF